MKIVTSKIRSNVAGSPDDTVDGDRSASPELSGTGVGSSIALRLCLSAAGGGHLRQLFDLEPVWRDANSFVVTEKSALGRTLAQRSRAYAVPHFALGQARLGAPARMLRLALTSLFRSATIVLRERPDAVITTGSGSQLFVVIWARVIGAHVILVDSFARFDGPSMFARLAGPLAHVRIAQSAASGAKWPGALVFDPFRILDMPRPAKEPLLVATVGATLPFDRLVTTVAKAHAAGLIPERVVIQTGNGGIRPDGLDTVEALPFDELQDLQGRADLLVCHGGTGSLITALRAGCRVIAMPRRFDLGEHYDDHQSEIVEAFVQRGLIHTAATDAEFAEALVAARGAKPVSATTDPKALLAFLRNHLTTLATTQARKGGLRQRWRSRRRPEGSDRHRITP